MWTIIRTIKNGRFLEAIIYEGPPKNYWNCITVGKIFAVPISASEQRIKCFLPPVLSTWLVLFICNDYFCCCCCLFYMMASISKQRKLWNFVFNLVRMPLKLFQRWNQITKMMLKLKCRGSLLNLKMRMSNTDKSGHVSTAWIHKNVEKNWELMFTDHQQTTAQQFSLKNIQLVANRKQVLPLLCWIMELINQFLTQNSMVTLSHAPYSPDLAPGYFILLPQMVTDM